MVVLSCGCCCVAKAQPYGTAKLGPWPNAKKRHKSPVRFSVIYETMSTGSPTNQTNLTPSGGLKVRELRLNVFTRARVERGGAGSLDVCFSLIAKINLQCRLCTRSTVSTLHENTVGEEDEYAPLLKDLVPESEAGLGPMRSRVSRSMKEGNNSVTFKNLLEIVSTRLCVLLAHRVLRDSDETVCVFANTDTQPDLRDPLLGSHQCIPRRPLRLRIAAVHFALSCVLPALAPNSRVLPDLAVLFCSWVLCTFACLALFLFWLSKLFPNVKDSVLQK